MNAKKIIFPTDFSTTAIAALEEAAALARSRGATLLIVHVQEPSYAYRGEFYYGLPEPDVESLTDMLHSVEPKGDDVRCEYRLLVGDPAAEIVRLAREEDADMIVMATHGRSGLLRLLMGSVAEAVIRSAPCPVLTYKTPRPTRVTAKAGI
jgi:nucleotide-binding universal stress UspA family protein